MQGRSEWLRNTNGTAAALRLLWPHPLPIRDGFTFEDVGFRYPGAERWAVRRGGRYAELFELQAAGYR